MKMPAKPTAVVGTPRNPQPPGRGAPTQQGEEWRRFRAATGDPPNELSSALSSSSLHRCGWGGMSFLTSGWWAFGDAQTEDPVAGAGSLCLPSVCAKPMAQRHRPSASGRGPLTHVPLFFCRRETAFVPNVIFANYWKSVSSTPRLM